MEFSDLIQTVTSYSDATETETLLTTAYKIASEVHQGFYRINGEPFLSHCLAVAGILAEWHAPPSVVAVGMLHDIHSLGYSHEYNVAAIQPELDRSIFDLLEAVFSLNSFIRSVERDIHNKADEQEVSLDLDSFLQRDRNALVIKIADRIHNLQTISALKPEMQKRTANIGFKLLAPLTSRLGMEAAKRFLEDYCFEINNPADYMFMQQRSADVHKSVHCLLEELQQKFRSFPVKNEVCWLPVSFYALYRQQIMQYAKQDKITQRELHPFRLVDVGSFIILIEEEVECYRLLGMLHKLYPPVEGQFEDFIANPKENGYQSLHTQVKHPSGNLRVIIRTHQMDLVAEYGITARWRNIAEEHLPQIPKETKHIEGGMQVFTPKGEIKYLPQGSTVLDFAYSIHSDVGHRCAGALVNGNREALHRPLYNGDMVEIIEGGPNTEPDFVWLDYVRSPQAINRIRQWLSLHQRNIMAERGRTLLENALQPLGLSLEDALIHQLLLKFVSRKTSKDLPLKDLSIEVEDLLVSIGIGRYPVAKLVKSLKSMRLKSVHAPNHVEPGVDISVLSTEEAQLPYVLAHCCEPVPPDDIIGYRRKDGMLAIHKSSCLQVKEAQKLIQVKWSTVPTEQNYVILVEALNRPGLASDVSTMVALLGLDMQGFNAYKRPDSIMAEIRIFLGKTTLAQRNRIRKALESTSYVTSVEIIHSSFLEQPAHSPEALKPVYLSNPYGPRIAEGPRFYGRQMECEHVSALLRNRSQNTTILLWGQKRIGKTSFVLRLQEHSQDAFFPVYLDLQGLRDSSTAQFLHELMHRIAKVVQQRLPDMEQKVTVPQYNRLRKDPLAYFDTFMGRIQEAALPYPLVVILDEFQCLCSLREEMVSRNAIFSRMRSYSQHSYGMHFILSGGGLKSQLMEQCGIDALFNVAYDEKLGCLEELAARPLIREGLSNVGGVSDPAIDLLINFTSGHPFYLQLLCAKLFEQAQEDKEKITQYFTSQTVQAWIAQTDENRFQHFWEGHDATSARWNKLLLSAIAELGINHHYVEYEHIAGAVYSLLPEYALIQALADLTTLGVLKRHHSMYAIEVELLVRWLRFHSPLKLALQEARWQ